jgi:hypothetical protein
MIAPDPVIGRPTAEAKPTAKPFGPRINANQREFKKRSEENLNFFGLLMNTVPVLTKSYLINGWSNESSSFRTGAEAQICVEARDLRGF